jgi:uncharacterized membrane protein
MSMKKGLIIAAGILFLATACSSGDEPKKGEVVSAIASGGEEDQESLKEHAAMIAAEEKEEAEMAKNVTTLKFDKDVHDFGSIATGSENDCEFVITNTGDKPLIVYNVGASCGCTTPQKPEKPIPPGKSDVLKVHFKPNGPGPSEKTVTVQANTDPRVSTVKIKATVK